MKTEELNENGCIQTQFDGKFGIVVGGHPHAGKTAKCLGAELIGALNKYGLKFKAHDAEFFIMDPKNIMWMKD